MYFNFLLNKGGNGEPGIGELGKMGNGIRREMEIRKRLCKAQSASIWRIDQEYHT